MADFNEAIKKVLQSEGGYSNDPLDKGGETYEGISRKNWPNWKGWELIDAGIRNSEELDEDVMSFYKENFWDEISGDNINIQQIADLLVDSAVNEGISPAIKRAQLLVGLPQTGKITQELIDKLNSL